MKLTNSTDEPAAKPCRRCRRRPAVRGEKFCVHCRRAAIYDMEKAGYLQPLPPAGRRDGGGGSGPIGLVRATKLG